MKSNEVIGKLNSDELNSELRRVYVTNDEIEFQKTRYENAAKSFEKIFGEGRDITFLSAPGRTEICGNHTDHNNGKVLAAAINLDAIAVASPNGENFIRVKSEGFDMDYVALDELEPMKEQFGKSESLLRGVCARLRDLGYKIDGFDAYTTSRVFSGSGLSSSAAYEVLLGTIFNHLFNDGALDDVLNAQIAQYAENVFFGKPCGLMDQMASSVGSFVAIDFANPAKPVIDKVDFDFAHCEHSLCILDTGGNHADLTGEYAAVRSEMEAVAAELGKDVLEQVEYDDFIKAVPNIRKKLGDRAVLRTIHFFNENKRVEAAVNALDDGDFDAFKNVLLLSGQSSYMYNQNVFNPNNVKEQGVSLALALSQQILHGKGVYRVHGGGFAGTIQAFVPNNMLDTYKTQMENVFGDGTCYVLSIRPVGGVKVF